MYHSWQRHAPAQIEVVSITPPGRLERIGEAPFDDFDSYVESLAVAIAADTGPPFAFFGHSMGALIAFEVTRWLGTHTAYAPTRLIVAACAAPSVQTVTIPDRYMSLPDGDLLRWVNNRYGSHVVALSENSELLALGMAAFRDDLKLARNYVYRPAPPLSCAISALFGQDDAIAGPTEMRLWAAETSGEFEISGLNGGHMLVHDSTPAVRQFAWSRVVDNQNI